MMIWYITINYTILEYEVDKIGKNIGSNLVPNRS